VLRVLIAKIFLFFSPILFSQNESGDYVLHLENRWGDPNFTQFQYHEIRFEAYLNDYFSFNYKLGLGKRHYDDRWHFKAPMGATVGLPLFGIGLISVAAAAGDGNCPGYDSFGNAEDGGEYDEFGSYVGCENDGEYGWGILGLFGIGLALIPNDITVNIPIGQYFKVSPYLDFGSFHLSTRPNTGSDAVYLNYSWGFGTRFGFMNKKGLEVSAFYERGGIQKVSKSNFFGFSVGYNFRYLNQMLDGRAADI
jgi:hypothetical protein